MTSLPVKIKTANPTGRKKYNWQPKAPDFVMMAFYWISPNRPQNNQKKNSKGE